MKRALLPIGAAGLTAAVAFFATGSATATSQAGTLDAAQLKTMIEGMGYETKALNSEPGKEKYEWVMKKPEFDVPIAGEISPSKNFIWLTAYLGKAPDESSPKNAAILKRIAKIQPCMFWVSDKGSLMIGVAVENRAVTPIIFKRHVDKLAEDVVSTADIWNK